LQQDLDGQPRGQNAKEWLEVASLQVMQAASKNINTKLTKLTKKKIKNFSFAPS